MRSATLTNSMTLLIGLVLAALVSTATYANTKQDKQRIKRMVVEEALEHGVDPELALAIAYVESNFDPHVVSHAGARGVMQIMPKTGMDVFNVHPSRLFDARTNIDLGVRFIKQLIDQYGRVDIALSHYNGGSRVKDKYGRLRVIPVTRPYVNKVLAKAKVYSFEESTLIASVAGTAPRIDDDIYTYAGADNSYVAMQARAKELRELRSKNLRLASAISHNVDPYLNAYGADDYTQKRYDSASAYVAVGSSKRGVVRQWESIYND